MKKTVIGLVSNKGGVVKSGGTSLAAATAEMKGLRAIMLDSDGSNSSTLSAFPDGRFVDMTRPEGIGRVLAAIDQLGNETADCAIWDTAAHQESAIIKVLPMIMERCKKSDVKFIVIRPITSSHFVQRGALDFLSVAGEFGLHVIYANIYAQGRTEHDFRFWMASGARKRALESVVEMAVADGGAFLGDNVVAFGLSLSDVALGRFSRISDKEERKEAERLFDTDFRAFVSGYLYVMTERVNAAIEAVLARGPVQVAKK